MDNQKLDADDARLSRIKTHLMAGKVPENALDLAWLFRLAGEALDVRRIAATRLVEDHP